jgi:membrane protease YdiL (CAAX protease family)
LLLIASFALKPLLPPALVQTEIPGPLPALLGSVSAGFNNEEIWLRLGLMTCLIWLGSKLIRQLRPGVRVIWVANVLAALLFGVLHLPQVAMLAEGLTLVAIM